MSSQYAIKTSDEKKPEVSADAFEDINHVIHLYNDLKREYKRPNGILEKYAYVDHAKNMHPPYWNTAKGMPEELPLHQHNVSSGIFCYYIGQVGLTYNSFFPNRSYSANLIDIDIIPDELTQVEIQNDPTVLQLREEFLAKGFDNLIKHSPWAQRAHIQMVDDVLHFPFGMYHFPNAKDIAYHPVDVRKVMVPSGTSIETDQWEYIFIEENMPFHVLFKHYKKGGAGWNQSVIEEFFKTYIRNNNTSGGITGKDPVQETDAIKEGLSVCALTKVCPSVIPVINIFWRNDQNKISCGKLISPEIFANPDTYIYTKGNAYDKFSHAFSVFLTNDNVSELRMARSWGLNTINLAHAYDRAFCKFLDAIEQASSLFLKINPADLSKKILHLGSIIIGQFEEAKKMPHALEAIIASLAYLEGKLNQVTFSTGLSRTELSGEGRGAQLAETILSMEGRVHKHMMNRFLECYTRHWSEVLRKTLVICNSPALRAANPEVEHKFYKYVTSHDIPPSIFKLDSISERTGSGLPSNWVIASKQPDGTGVNPGISRTIELLTPYLSSIPETGFKYLLARLVAEAFGDPEAITHILPDADVEKISTETDLQMAEVQAHILTIARSDFDFDIEISENINPELSDAPKFVTFPPNKRQDNRIFAAVLLGKVDDAVGRLTRREIGRTTLHIWLYNLVSTLQGHINYLQQDQIRGKRPEAQELYQRFGAAFNLLRQVEAQANADRQKKLDMLQQKLAEQEQDDPKRIEAEAKLLTARARMAEAQVKYDANRIDSAIAIQGNRREEEAHVMDSALKVKTLREPSPLSQELLGRPRDNDQARKTG